MSLPAPFNKQIQSMFYKDGLSIEQISSALELQPASVALVVNQSKPRDVRVERRESALNGLNDYIDQAMAVMGELLDAENECVRYKAAEFIVEAGLDMKQPPAKVVPATNVLVFQEILMQSNAAYEAQLRKHEEKKALDIASEKIA